MKRADALVADGSISEREHDQTRATLLAAQAGLRQAGAQQQIGQQDVRSVIVGRGGLEASVAAAQAQLHLAQVDLDNTIIRAPVDGQLSEIGVRNGAFVSAGTQLMFLVPRDLWVIANFKEAQTRKMRVGQPASFKVDAPGRCEAHRPCRESLARGGIGIRGAQVRQCDRQFREGGAAHRGAHPDRSRTGHGEAAASGHVGRAACRDERLMRPLPAAFAFCPALALLLAACAGRRWQPRRSTR